MTGDTAGGVWTFAIDLSEGLIERGVDVCLATFGPSPSDAQKSAAGDISGLRWFHLTSKLEWMSTPWSDIEAAGEWLLQLGRQESPDLIHLNTLSHGDLGWDVPVVTTVHSCVCSWWSAVKESPLPLEWQLYRERVESSLRSSILLVAPSTEALRCVSRHYRVDTTDSLVLFNGRSAAHFRQAEKEPVVLAVGRFWDEAKNLRTLTNIASDLPWPVYLAGDTTGPEGNIINWQGCHALGNLSPAELASWYARAAIYVSPARYEPFGLSVLEAALSGCALVLSDIPSFREIWRDSALFFDAKNPSELTHTLKTLIAQPALRQELSRCAKQRALSFSVDRMTDGYLTAYRKVLEMNQAREWSTACVS